MISAAEIFGDFWRFLESDRKVIGKLLTGKDKE